MVTCHFLCQMVDYTCGDMSFSVSVLMVTCHCLCQVRDEYRTDYDSGRGGYGKLVKQKLQIQA